MEVPWLSPAPPDPVADLPAWWPVAAEVSRTAASPFEATVQAGARADRLAFAFASGYQAALRRLSPELPPGILSFAVSEATGSHPRKLTCAARSGAGACRRLTGDKSFATLGPVADYFVVVARGEASTADRPHLDAVLVHRDAPGLTVGATPEAPFAPELPHARLRFEDTPGEVLPGDGYTAYCKPFRTIEDVHVLAAGLACLLRAGAARGLPRAVLERGAGVLSGLAPLAAAPALCPATHLSLAGLFALAAPVVDAVYARLDPSSPADQRFVRDRPLFDVAGPVRARRADVAWAALTGEAPP